MPTAVAAARQSYADHPMVRLETAPPGPCHAVSLQETLSGTFTACATVILDELCQKGPVSAVSSRTTAGDGRPKVAELCANSATVVDRLLPQIGKRVVALHPPLFHPQVDLQGTRRRLR